MENIDLTILFLTTSRVPEKWAEYQRKCLLEAAGNYPIISISRKPLDFGTNYLDTDEVGYTNFYRQFLRAAKLATTPFVAIAEDDTLYTKDHFDSFRPPLHVFAYNMNRWSLFTWGEPLYSRKDNRVGAASINPRELAIAALEERFAKYPKELPPSRRGELGIGGEAEMGVSVRESCGFYSSNPIIQFNHDFFSADNTGAEAVERRHKKRMGAVRAYDIPFWGKSKDLVKKFI